MTEISDVSGFVGCQARGCRGVRSASPEPSGRLCVGCLARLRGVVRGCVPLVRELLSGRASRPLVESAGGGSPGSRSLYPGSLEVADELVAVVAEYAERVAEERGERLTCAGLWWSKPSRKIDPETGEPYLVEAEVVGVRDAEAISALVSWLDLRLEWVSEQDWAVEMLEDLSRLSASASRWAQVEEPDRRVRDIVCPKCSAHSLVVCPPRAFGADEQVMCARPSCGAVLTSVEWKKLRAWSVFVARMNAEEVSV